MNPGLYEYWSHRRNCRSSNRSHAFFTLSDKWYLCSDGSNTLGFERISVVRKNVLDLFEASFAQIPDPRQIGFRFLCQLIDCCYSGQLQAPVNTGKKTVFGNRAGSIGVYAKTSSLFDPTWTKIFHTWLKASICFPSIYPVRTLRSWASSVLCGPPFG